MELSKISLLRKDIIEPEIFAQEGQKFLERIRNSSAYELVRHIKVFITTFTTMDGPPDRFSTYFQSFMDDMAAILCNHPLWKDDGERGLREALDALERYLLHKLYSTAFYFATSSDAEDDEKFYHRVRTLQFLQPGHLDIQPGKYNELAFEMAAQEFSGLEEDLLKSPREKLTCLMNAVTILANLLVINNQETGADIVLPYFIYLLLLSSPKHIHSNLRYIHRFRRQSVLSSEEKYYLVQIESAVMFLLTLSHTNLSITEEAFERGITEAKQRIRNGADIPRRFSRESWERVASSLSVKNRNFEEPPNIPGENSMSPIPLQNAEAADSLEKDKEILDTPQLPSKDAIAAFPSSVDDGLDKDQIAVDGVIAAPDTSATSILISINEWINPEIISTKFEDLTICDIRKLHSSYIMIANKITQHLDSF